MDRLIVDIQHAKLRRITVWTPWGAVPSDRARMAHERRSALRGATEPPSFGNPRANEGSGRKPKYAS